MDDEISNFNTQASSQWDGFRHVRHLVHGYYGGLDSGDPARCDTFSGAI